MPAEAAVREGGAQLRAYVCGRLAIETPGRLLTEREFPARQGRRLWAWLVLHRQRPAGREEAAVAVWGDELPDSWDAALSALVSRLRRMLRPLAAESAGIQIQGDAGRYVLEMPNRSFIDIERARLGLHAAETSLLRHDHDAALSEALVAMEISGRGFLAGEDAAWIAAARRDLSDITIRALECTVESELGRGNPRTAEREARRLIDLEPLRESSYRLLMRALADSGNAAQISRVLADCREALWEHAAIAPSRQTVQLFETLTGQDPPVV